jgi:hypothetical protein
MACAQLARVPIPYRVRDRQNTQIKVTASRQCDSRLPRTQADSSICITQACRKVTSHLQRAHEKGQVLREYARENKLCKHTLYRWHTKFRQRGLIGESETSLVQSAFVPVRVEPPVV